MKIIQNPRKFREALQALKSRGKKIGFVPTMGALHEGHGALLRRSSSENDVTVLSIFVNPAQFGPGEDYRRYPRDIKKDCLLAKKENVDIILRPSVEDLYPDSFLTYVNVGRISEVLCGKSRPGHFRGVATIVAKLLNIVDPDVLYLGQKDYQQCVVLKQMIRDLNVPVRVVVVPTLRERDGLAMSSRNQYLTAQERQQAPVLYQSLCLAKAAVRRGERQAAAITGLISAAIQKRTAGKIDYVACVHAETLEPVETIAGKTVIALAVWLGRARLIDNIIVQVKT